MLSINSKGTLTAFFSSLLLLLEVLLCKNEMDWAVVHEHDLVQCLTSARAHSAAIPYVMHFPPFIRLFSRALFLTQGITYEAWSQTYDSWTSNFIIPSLSCSTRMGTVTDMIPPDHKSMHVPPDYHKPVSLITAKNSF